MFTRIQSAPNCSFFLFGPRGTGKTTWLRQQLPDAKWFDLRQISTMLAMSREPALLKSSVVAMPAGSWIVLDEIQCLPRLLNEVHAIISERGDDYQFALCGSSTRKLRESDANVLAGRVMQREFFPLIAQELQFSFDLDDILRHGTLPLARSAPSAALDTLDRYLATYLREEVREEALTRDIAAFARFVEVAALSNGQVVNVARTARDAGVARPTVSRYYDALVDTLIGFWLPAWTPRARIKEVQHPKFYLFDPGVARALAGRLREPLDGEERAPLLETLILHELRAAMNIHQAGGQLAYWRTPSGSEVDFIWSRGDQHVGIEVKASSRWRREYSTTLNQLVDRGVLTRAFLVYNGTEELRDRKATVLPVREFMRRAASGAIFA